MPLARSLGDTSEIGVSNIRLGNALLVLGDRVGQREGRALLELATQAFETAIEALTPETHAWSSALAGRAATRKSMALMGDREEQLALLELALLDIRQAADTLERLGQTDAWAHAQSGVASTHARLASLRPGDADGIYMQALSHFENALTVHDQNGRPQEWGGIQRRIATLYRDWGERLQGQARVDKLALAYNHSLGALEVYSPEAQPVPYAATLDEIGMNALGYGRLLAPDQGLTFVELAVAAHRESLTIMDQTGTPRFWANCQAHLGLAAGVLGWMSPIDREEHFIEGIGAINAALSYYTEDLYPDSYVHHRDTLSVLLEQLGSLTRNKHKLAEALAVAAESAQYYEVRGLVEQAKRTRSNVEVIEREIASI